MDIRVGMVFDTAFETNCVVTSEPDAFNTFLAFDSEGVECHYGVNMVQNLRKPTISDHHAILMQHVPKWEDIPELDEVDDYDETDIDDE